MKRCLVLGGRGFIGSHLVQALLDKGHFVRCFDRPNVAPLAASHLANSRFELMEGDLASDTDTRGAVQDIDVCFHLISTTLPKSSNLDPAFDVQSNLLGTIHLLQNAVRSGVKKVVFVSSGGTVYGTPRCVPVPESHPTDPLCSYGITKLSIEKYLDLFCQLYGLDYMVLRLANPFGEGQRIHASQGAIAVFLGKVMRNEPIEIWGDGTVVRDYIHVADVVEALLLSMNKDTSEKVINIGSGLGHSLNDVLGEIEIVTGRKVNYVYQPGRAFDAPISVLDIKRARQVLGWVPRVGFGEGLLSFWKWLQTSKD